MTGVEGAVIPLAQTAHVEQSLKGDADPRVQLESAAAIVARLGHDFNNILTGVIGFLELSLASMSPGYPEYDLIKEAHQSAQAGWRYTRLLSLFSKRTSGTATTLDLAGLVEEEAERFRKAWGGRPHLQLAVDKSLPPVCFERDAALHVLSALFENASEAIASGAGTVTLSAFRTELAEDLLHGYLGDLRPGSHIVVTVEDTGAGFSAEARDRVFVELFYTSKKRRFGLGLLTTYGILRNYRGGLKIEHLPAQGTRVHVLIPLALEPLGPTPESELPGPAHEIVRRSPDGSQGPLTANPVVRSKVGSEAGSSLKIKKCSEENPQLPATATSSSS
jgi:signal transduction histidine kinase